MTAQEYLNKNWTDKNLTEIHYSSSTEKLAGELTITDYPNLEEINLTNQGLTTLIINNCPNLKQINVRNNQLTKLELNTADLEEIIAGQNELTALDLTNCQKIKKLIVPDNPYLNKLTGLNLSLINNFNIANTQVSLSQDYEELKQENERLLKALGKVDKARVEKELKFVEPIQTAKQAEEAIQRHLKEIEIKWREYFESNEPEKTKKQNPLLALSFEDPDLNWKAKAVLSRIIEAINNRNYSDLIKFWNEGDEFNPKHDFDGSLEALMQLWLNYQFLLNREKNITV